jgi:hypothetical protein
LRMLEVSTMARVAHAFSLCPAREAGIPQAEACATQTRSHASDLRLRSQIQHKTHKTERNDVRFVF